MSELSFGEAENWVDFVERQIGYKFVNRDLLVQAFVRKSYSMENGGENNEVLEFIGDKALDLAVVKTLTDKYGHMISDEPDYEDEYKIGGHCFALPDERLMEAVDGISGFKPFVWQPDL